MNYHLNPFSGEPGLCRAKKGKCPFGEASQHFSSLEAAQAAYEELQKEDYVASLQKAAQKEQVLEVPASGVAKAGEEAPLKRSYLSSQEVAESISMEGINCPHCGVQLTPEQASTILDYSRAEECSRCEKYYDIISADIQVGKHKDTYGALQAENVKKLDWWHSTTSETWSEALAEEETFYAHVGSEQAAFDRQISELYTYDAEKPGFYLHRLRVKPEATVGAEVSSDENSDYDHSFEEQSDVERYINKWEDMASVSLAVKSSMLEVVESRFVSAREALAKPSLYNLEPTARESGW